MPIHGVRLFVYYLFTPSERLCDVFLQVCPMGVANTEKGSGCLFDLPRTNFFCKRGVANLEYLISKPPFYKPPFSPDSIEGDLCAFLSVVIWFPYLSCECWGEGGKGLGGGWGVADGGVGQGLGVDWGGESPRRVLRWGKSARRVLLFWG